MQTIAKLMRENIAREEANKFERERGYRREQIRSDAKNFKELVLSNMMAQAQVGDTSFSLTVYFEEVGHLILSAPDQEVAEARVAVLKEIEEESGLKLEITDDIEGDETMFHLKGTPAPEAAPTPE